MDARRQAQRRLGLLLEERDGASLRSRPAPARAPPAACSAPRDRSTRRTAGWVSGSHARRRARSRPAPRGNARSDAAPHRPGGGSAPRPCRAAARSRRSAARRSRRTPSCTRPAPLLDGAVLDHQEAPALRVAPLGAHCPASMILAMSASGTGSGFNRRIARVVWMMSKRSVLSGMGSIPSGELSVRMQ